VFGSLPHELLDLLRRARRRDDEHVLERVRWNDRQRRLERRRQHQRLRADGHVQDAVVVLAARRN